MLLRKTAWFWKSGLAVISFVLIFSNSDLAFRNTVVVQSFEDGTFRYLSNSIEQIELELPPIAKSQQR